VVAKEDAPAWLGLVEGGRCFAVILAIMT